MNMDHKPLPLGVSQRRIYSPYHYGLEIDRRNENNLVIGNQIDNNMRTSFGGESRYTPLRNVSQFIFNNRTPKYIQKDKEQSLQINTSFNVNDDLNQKYEKFQKEANDITNHYSKYKMPSSYQTEINKESYSKPVEIKTNPNENYYQSKSNKNLKQDLISQSFDLSRNPMENNQIKERYEEKMPSEYSNYMENQKSYEKYKYPESQFPISINLNRRKRNLFPRFQDSTRRYMPTDHNYAQSRFGDQTYNWFLNSPMRGDISNDWQYPPQYYYNSRKANNLSNNINY